MKNSSNITNTSFCATRFARRPTGSNDSLIRLQVSASISAEGSVQSCDIKGALSLTANEDSGASVVVIVDKGVMDRCAIPFSINTHPKIDKKR